MIEWLTSTDGLADGWGAALWRASWQGAIAIGLVWLVCRAFSRIPARVKCWLWRLAYLKLLLLLVWASPVRLPVLPAAVEASTPLFSTETLTLLAGVGVPPASTASADPPTAPAITPSPAALEPAPTRFPWLPCLMLAWAIGVGWRVAGAGREWWRVRSVRLGSKQVETGPVTAILTSLSETLRVARSPELAQSDAVETPLLTGILRPTIILPPDLIRDSSEEQIRLMLAHELVHLRRRDLLWGWLPLVVDAILFFHPLLWLANWESRLTQELACDETCVLAIEAEPSSYGQVLLRAAGVNGSGPRKSPAAVCISESRQTVKARVRAVEHIAPMSRKRLAIAVTAVLLLATVGTVPWKLTRAVADAEETPPAWVSPDVTSDPVEIMFSILDPNGQPLADRDLKVGVYGHDELLLETDTYTIHRGLSVAPAEKTDAAGRVTIREFAGKITPICMVHKLGYGIGPRFDLEPGDRIQVTIKLQPFASVHGTLVDAETGEVIHGANIGWNAAEESFLGTPDAPVVTNTRGAFLVADLVPGNYEIYARADGYARVGTHLFAPPGAQQEITFRAEREDPARLPATGDVDTAGPESRPPVAGSGDIASGLTAIVGTVVDSGGRPVANGLVHAFVAPLAPGAEREDGFSDAPMYVREGATSHSTGLYQTRVTPWQPAPVRTGELGEFSVPRPDAEGELWLIASDAEGSECRALATSPDSDDIVVSLSARAACGVRGRFRYSDGQPVEEASIRINRTMRHGRAIVPWQLAAYWIGTGEHPQVVGDREGRFELTGLIPGGRYEIVADGPRLVYDIRGAEFTAASDTITDLGTITSDEPSPDLAAHPQWVDAEAADDADPVSTWDGWTHAPLVEMPPASPPFGMRKHPVTGRYKRHTGIDLPCVSGTPIRAVADGDVVHAGWYGAFGLAVVLDHGDGWETLYGHCSRVAVSEGQRFAAKVTIARSGSTGYAIEPHLHFEVRKDGKPVDPAASGFLDP